MKIFVYKTLFVLLGVYLLYQFTIGKKIEYYEYKAKSLTTDQGREIVRDKIREEIKKVQSGKFDKDDNPLKNAPHTHIEVTANEWKHKYDRESAAYPSPTLKSYKYWPPVARVNNVYGDKNLFCSCPTMDEYKESAA